jgi:hypothetical protein
MSHPAVAVIETTARRIAAIRKSPSDNCLKKFRKRSIRLRIIRMPFLTAGREYVSTHWAVSQ